MKMVLFMTEKNSTDSDMAMVNSSTVMEDIMKVNGDLEEWKV